MEQITFSEALEELSQYDPALWIGAIAAIVVFIVELSLYKKGLIFASGDKKLERAQKAGNVIPATMIKCRYKDKEPSDKTINRMYIATYEYSVNGEKRTKRIVTTGSKPPYNLSFYYEDNPDRIFSSYDIRPSRWQFLLYVIPILVAVAVMKMLGFST